MSFWDFIKNFITNNKKDARFITKTLIKTYGEPDQLEVGLYDKNTPIDNEEIGIEVNGKQYIRTTDNDGIARLNINLGAGNYTAKLYWRGINGEYNSVTGYVDIIVNPAPEPEPVQPSGDKKPIILGCDANTEDDSTVQNRIAERLEAEGYPVEKLPIGPNYFASTDYSSKAKGKIGIYLIASGIFSIADATYGSGQFDNYIFGIRGDFGDRGATNFDLPIRADADCTSICDKLNGKTFNQMNAMLQPYVAICGGADTDELANNIIDWLNRLEQDDPEPTPEPEPEQPSTELYEYFTNQGGGYLGQKTGYTCACHSLVQCFRRLTGEDVSEMTLASVCGTTTDGTDHEGINTGVAWFNREYNQNIKINWYNFSELGNSQDERFNKVQEMINNGAVFFHLLYRDTWGHYEVIKEAWDDPLVILNSLGDDCGDGYCGYIEYRSRSDQVSYINGISQKSVCIITRG